MMRNNGRHKIHDDSYVDYISQENIHFLLYKDNGLFQCMKVKH